VIRGFIFSSILASLMVSPLGAVAQTPAGAPAQLMRVTEGVFALTPGKSIDLTSEKILLTLPQDNRARSGDRFWISINGRRSFVQVGTQIDLKVEVNANSRRGQRGDNSGLLSGKDHCVLDVIDFVEPRGGLPTVTFRLNCL
jgi:hypothetical protein